MNSTKNPILAPQAPRKPFVVDSPHGHKREDHFYWLRERENPEVINYLEAENAFTTAQMAHLKDFQENLFQEIKSRIKEQDESVPYKLDDYWYYQRYEKGSEYAIHARKKQHMDDPEEILIDLNTRAVGHEFYECGGITLSDNHQIMAFAEDRIGRRLYTVRFKDLQTGQIIENEEIDLVEGGAFEWAHDNKTLFYVRKDPQTLRSYQVFRHTLGTPTADDVLVYEEKDESYYTGIYRSKSKAFIGISLSSTTTTEVHLIDTFSPDSNFLPRVCLPRERDHEYGVAHFEQYLYITTNWQAKNFRLMRCLIEEISHKERWEEIIPHRDDVLLEDLDLFKDFLVLTERKAGLLHIRIMPTASEEYYLDFGEPAYTAYLHYNPDFNTDALRYAYTSLTTPNSVIEFDMRNRTKVLLKQQEVLGKFNAEDYTSERLTATAPDGTAVPMSLVYHKKLNRTETQPVYLYGYGSYGHSIDPYFSSARLSLLDRGFIFVIAHIRGGEDMGRYWYDEGRLLQKKNTFSDFEACAQHLIQQGYTAAKQIYAVGGSAGGLLVGAVANMYPDTYGGIVAHVPFVDVVTTMLDDTIPLTTNEYDEWGNPANEEFYHYMLSYSPYDNIKAQNYPHILVTSGLHDSQVQYWESTKWVARLRELKIDQNKLLLHTNMEAGHGGASGRFARLKEVALEYAFILDLAQRTDFSLS
ncbi:MAG: S9 family peptidase [Cytophagales bacterium]|nr:MAG: S9 family peptidase [Cytophagales bacterium]